LKKNQRVPSRDIRAEFLEGSSAFKFPEKLADFVCNLQIAGKIDALGLFWQRPSGETSFFLVPQNVNLAMESGIRKMGH